MSGKNLMEHWKIVRLEEIADMRGGASFPKAYQGNTEGKYPFYKVSDMNIEGNETLMQASNNWIEEDTVEILRAKLFSKDTVVFPKVGAAVHTNKKRLLSCDSLVDNNVMGVTIRDYNLCIPYYLLYWFESVDLADFSNPGPLPSITVSTVKSAKIPLPPLPEQRAIAHVLQTIQEAKSTRQREVVLERERKAALMDYLFSYGTKGEPRKETEIGEIPESWGLVELNKVCSKIVDCPHSTPKFLESGVLCARNFNIRSGIYVREPASYTSEAEYLERIKRLIPQEGDVLFSREAPIGEACLIPPDTRLSLGQRMMLLRVNSLMLDAYFLVQSFYVTPLRTKMLSLGRGATAKHLNVRDVKQLEIPIPPLNEQQEISEILQACDTKIAALEQEAERLDELFHAMLHELMTGQRSAVPLIDSGLPN